MKYMLTRFTLSVFLTGIVGSLFAQDTWSLQRCIQYARDNNITVKQAQATVRINQLSESASKAARLPTISASVNLGEQFGRTINPTTNQFSTEAVTFNGGQLSINMPLYQGGQINNTIKQSRYNVEASAADAEQIANNLGLQIAQSYLNILLGQEQLKNALNRVELSKKQLINTQKLIDAGTIPMADKYNILAQIAREEQAAVVSQNNVDMAYLSLKQLLQLEPDYDLRIEKPTLAIPTDSDLAALNLPGVYAVASKTQPAIRAAEFRVKSAESGIDIARAAYYPSLSLFASASTNYSSLFPDAPVLGNPILSTPVPVVINGVLSTISYPTREVLETPTVPYLKQIDRNFGQSFGVGLNIPIYSNGRNRLGVERARLSLLTTQMQQTQTQQTLKSDIQTALASARSAAKQLDAANKTFEATQTAYTNMEKRHTLGAVNTLDLSTAKNNLDIAENDLTVARFDYLFRLKILDFYLGRPIVLE